MTGDWIKWVKGLAKRPEVLEMARMMNRSRHEVAGLLMEFWEWADDNVTLETESANCPGFVRIASASCPLVNHLAGADGFAEAMTSVGWLVIRDGRLEFAKYGRHNGKSAKRRASDAERKRNERSHSPESVPNLSASNADKKRTREEKRREENKDSNPPPPLPFTSPAFVEAWSKWERHRKEINAKLKPTTIEQQFKRFASWGEERSIAAIYHTIEKGWTGLVEPNGGVARSPPARRETPDERDNRMILEAKARDAQQGKDNHDGR